MITTTVLPTNGTPVDVSTLGTKIVRITGQFSGVLYLEFADTAAGPWTELGLFVPDLLNTEGIAFIAGVKENNPFFVLEAPVRYLRLRGEDFTGSPTAVILAKPTTGDFSEQTVNGGSAFGDVRIAELWPVVQLEFGYGINPRKLSTYLFGAATASTSGGLLELATTGVIGDTAYVRSFRPMVYRVGQGSVARFTARFDTPALNLSQLFGLFGGSENGIFIGYDYQDATQRFGVCRQYGGVREIQTLTVTAGAAGAENATVTLNGAATVVPLTAGSAAATAQKLAEATYSGWSAYALGSTVIFLATEVGNKAGAFTFASTGTAAGTFAETRAGADVTNQWFYQDEWNIDQLDGYGPSGVTLNPAVGNVFEIKMQYLGYGAIEFRIENPTIGRFFPFHRIVYANANPNPTFTNSVFTPGAVISDRGAGVARTIRTASMAGFADGRVIVLGSTHGDGHTKTGIGATSVPIFSVRNDLIYNNQANFRRAIFKILTAAQYAGKFVQGALIKNATLTNPLWTVHEPGQSFSSVDTSATAYTGGQDVINFAISTNLIIDLENLDVTLEAGETITFVAASTGGGPAADVLGSLSWIEDI